jgi:diguanylate cyclase (GGDEF)-like protein
MGFLMGSINLTRDYFVEELMGYKIGKTGYVYLFNADRTMIIHPDKNRIMKQDVPVGTNKYFDLAVKGFEGSGETVNSRGVPQLASFKQLRTVNWILASAFPLEEAYAPVKEIRNSLFFATALVTLCSIVLVWMLTSKIISGLNSFTGQVREIMEHPEGKHEIHIDSNDEVTLLATTFNKLMNELDLTREELERLTRTDHLTGLFNRRHLGLEAPKLIELSERKNTTTAVVLVDVDHFKKINDTHGHEAGDAVLVFLAKTLQRTVRPYDLVVRYGGEEFLVLLPMSTGQESLEIAERIRRTIQETPVRINHEMLSVTVSLGIYVSAHIDDVHAAIMRADEALYNAKNNGRNQVCVAPAQPVGANNGKVGQSEGSDWDEKPVSEV